MSQTPENISGNNVSTDTLETLKQEILAIVDEKFDVEAIAQMVEQLDHSKKINRTFCQLSGQNRHRREINVPLIINTRLYFSVLRKIGGKIFSGSALGVVRSNLPSTHPKKIFVKNCPSPYLWEISLSGRTSLAVSWASNECFLFFQEKNITCP
jgi:hypothetical protein